MRTLGAEGATWVSELPDVLAELADVWGLTLGRSVPGGSASYVTRVTQADGTPAVLKVSVDTDGLAEQIATLARARGRGYVRLLHADPERRALLMEGLGPALCASRLTPEKQLAVLVDTLTDAWLPTDRTPDTGDDKATGLRRLIERLAPTVGSDWPSGVYDQALAYADSLVGAEDDALVLVHGDPHAANALETREPGRAASGYVFVDPDGFVADRAYDLGVVLRDWCGRVAQPGGRATLERYCDLVADRSGVDRDRIWRWAYLERVTTGLYVLDIGAERVGRPYLDTATLLLN